MLRLSTVVPHWMDDAPSIIVSASCLKDFGFELGARVVVEVSRGLSLSSRWIPRKSYEEGFTQGCRTLRQLCVLLPFLLFHMLPFQA